MKKEKGGSVKYLSKISIIYVNWHIYIHTCIHSLNENFPSADNAFSNSQSLFNIRHERTPNELLVKVFQKTPETL